MADSRNCHEHISSAMHEYLMELEYRMQHEGEPLGLSTGIDLLDERLGGMRGGEVILLGARPAMGKTSFAINLSYKIAKSFLEEKEKNPNINKSVLWFSIDRPRICILQRLIAAKIPEVWTHQLTCYEYGTNSYEEFETIANIGREIGQLPIYICDDCLQTVVDIRRKITDISRYSTIGFIVIDYLQLINREYYSHEEILQELKIMAKDLNVPIFILSQLTSDLEKRKDKRPILKDIREFKIHGYFDKILFLYRENYYWFRYEPEKTPKETEEHFQKRHMEWVERERKQCNIAEIIIAKNNLGYIGRVKCYCNLSHCDFDDLPYDYLNNI